MKVKYAFSNISDSVLAAREILKEISDQTGPSSLTFLFTTDGYDHQVIIDTLKNNLPNTPIVGMCAGGIIFGTKVYENGIAVLSLSGSEVIPRTLLKANLSNNPFQAGIDAAKDIISSGVKEGVVFIFPDGFSSNLAETVRGIYSQLGPNFDYIGGGAGDNLKFFKTYQFTEKNFQSDAIALAVVSGIEIKIAVGHGWNPVGEPLIVTEAKGKRIYEIDGKPAFEAYKNRFPGVAFENFSEYGMKNPLGFTDLDGNYFIRDPLSVNPDGSIDCVTEVPSNAIGNIMEGDRPSLINTAKATATKARQNIKQPQFALICDCISRYLLMGKDFEKELESVRSGLDVDIPLVGVLTFGEIGSLKDIPFFHNKTIVIAVGGNRL